MKPTSYQQIRLQHATSSFGMSKFCCGRLLGTLFQVSLLIYEGSAQNENLVLVTKLNEFREKVAKGSYETQQGYLSPSQTMFELLRNKNLEEWADIATEDCRGLNMTPPGGSMNIYTISLSEELPSDTMITKAVSAWMNEMNLPAGQGVSSALDNRILST
ncbi:hypothetical protein GCK32_010890 [Trichostrongylus colubriformis]|uniref:Uncharacterized protein n=1 Tax=Trichostrongylus colubriformis TaxID=6319 RepID=A0AAN8G9R0_TRICO